MPSPQPGEKRRAPPTVDLTESTDEENGGDDIQCLGSAPASAPVSTKKKKGSSKSSTDQPVLGMLGLDRKKMEEERLRRLAERRATDDSEQRPAIRPARKSSPAASFLKEDSVGKDRPAIPGLLYPNGVVKRTWAKGKERSDDDIMISEVFQQSYNLELAVMSSFQWDMDWLFSKFDLKMRTRYLLVMGAKDEETRSSLLDDTKNVSALRLIFPPMGPQVNCMHSKLMLLFHETYLRVVVPSANLVPHDWGETGTMENVVFLIDLPKKTSKESNKAPFYDELSFFMRAQSFPEQIIGKMDLFDFSATSRFAFVHTIGGQHVGETAMRTGVNGLSRAVRQLKLATKFDLKLNYITSSLGSLSRPFLQSIYNATKGEDVIRTSAASKGTKDTLEQNKQNELDRQLLVHFPTHKTVIESIGGKNGAGTICLSRKLYYSKQFPRDDLRDSISRRTGLLMHNKMLFVRPSQPSTWPQYPTCRGWVYLGSANLSESAWGRSVKNNAAGADMPKLTCRNWESGVVIPVDDGEPKISSDGEETERGKKDEGEQEALTMTTSGATATTSSTTTAQPSLPEIFEKKVPLPLRVPAPTYAERRSEPWFFA